jgi:hypothetical protein
MGMLDFIFLTWKKNLMPRAFVYEDGSHTAKNGYQGNQPPSKADHANIQAITVPGT